jgi:hypothetical protein
MNLMGRVLTWQILVGLYQQRSNFSDLEVKFFKLLCLKYCPEEVLFFVVSDTSLRFPSDAQNLFEFRDPRSWARSLNEYSCIEEYLEAQVEDKLTVSEIHDSISNTLERALVNMNYSSADVNGHNQRVKLALTHKGMSATEDDIAALNFLIATSLESKLLIFIDYLRIDPRLALTQVFSIAEIKVDLEENVFRDFESPMPTHLRRQIVRPRRY